MKKICILALLFGSVLFTQCAHKTAAPTAAKANINAEKITTIKQNYTPEQMAQGEVIFRSNCNKCHKYYEPQTESINDWEKILPPMCQKAKLSAEDAGKVRAWVLTNAKMG